MLSMLLSQKQDSELFDQIDKEQRGEYKSYLRFRFNERLTISSYQVFVNILNLVYHERFRINPNFN